MKKMTSIATFTFAALTIFGTSIFANAAGPDIRVFSENGEIA